MLLKEELGFDSLRLVELIVALEEAFELEFDEADLDPAALRSVTDIRWLVSNKMGGCGNAL